MRSLYCLAVLTLLAACGTEQKFPTPSEADIDYVGLVSGIRIAVDADAAVVSTEYQIAEYIDSVYQQTADCMRINGWGSGNEPAPLVHIVSWSYPMYDDNGVELGGWTDTSGLITVKSGAVSVFIHEFVHYIFLVNTRSVGSHDHPAFSVCAPSY